MSNFLYAMFELIPTSIFELQSFLKMSQFLEKANAMPIAFFQKMAPKFQNYLLVFKLHHDSGSGQPN